MIQEINLELQSMTRDEVKMWTVEQAHEIFGKADSDSKDDFIGELNSMLSKLAEERVQ